MIRLVKSRRKGERAIGTQRTSFLLSRVSVYEQSRRATCFSRRHTDPSSFFPRSLEEASYECVRFPRRMSAKYRDCLPPLLLVFVHARMHRSTKEYTRYSRTWIVRREGLYTRAYRRQGTYPFSSLSLYLLTIVFDPAVCQDSSYRLFPCNCSYIFVSSRKTLRSSVDEIPLTISSTTVTTMTTMTRKTRKKQGQRWSFFPHEKRPRFIRPPPYESPRSMAVYARLSLCTTPLCLCVSISMHACVCARALTTEPSRASERASERAGRRF